ncbi:hypothetical protein ACHQM5_024323 [Ranunculus cassubicifolius]
MFVKKLVEKASIKKPAGIVNGIKPTELNPRLVFHHGIPSGSLSLAYDCIQKILAISTQDGRIKLLGKDNTQSLLQSDQPIPSKFMRFLENHGILFRVTMQNQIEVWDIERKELCDVYMFKEEITAFTVIQQTFFLVLIIFRDGLIVLWGIEESSVILAMGGNLLSLSNDTKRVTSACWVCPFGSKVVIGYSNGELFIWSVPILANSCGSVVDKELSSSQNAPICKLNLGYKMDKIPIDSLKWVYGEGKTSRLYVYGNSTSSSANMFQIVLLNEQTASRTIKLTLPLSETCLDMEIISCTSDQSKKKQNILLVMLKFGRLCMYDDSVIEKSLTQSNSRPHFDLPKEIIVRLPFTESRITMARFIVDDSNFLNDEDYNLLVKTFPGLLSIETRAKDESYSNSPHFSGFSKIKNMYVTGHDDGTINFWDVSSPLLLPVASIKQQNEDDQSLSGAHVTALYFDISSRILLSGDQSGMVRIFKFKPEPFSTENSFFSLQGSSKKGSSNIVNTVKYVKVNGVVNIINMDRRSRNFAVGCDKGYVYVIDIEAATIVFQSNVTSEVCNDITSLQFETCAFHGFEKHVLLVGTKDSSVLALESDTGNTLSETAVSPKKHAKSLFMQIIDVIDNLDSNGRNSFEASKHHSYLLLCNEKTVYIYSLTHVVQGIKKVLYKKKFHGTCCWASTFYNHDSGVALALLFPGGKIEIRSLPDLSLLKENTIRGFTYQNSLCSSSDGELISVNGDQEVFFVSLLLRKEIYRSLSPIGHVYKKGIIAHEEDSLSAPIIHKEKKRGIFSSVIKDLTSNKAKPELEIKVENSSVNIAEDLLSTFSISNFPLDKEITDNSLADKEDEVELNIDDIDFEDEKPKGQNTIAGINKQKIASKFLAIKGKLKQKMAKSEKIDVKAVQEDEKVDSIDQIKKKYGFASSGASDSSVGKMAENKNILHENLRKLQDINLRSTEMKDTAQSYSAMAKEMLRSAEKDKRIF